jgi:hypothetical protein
MDATRRTAAALAVAALSTATACGAASSGRPAAGASSQSPSGSASGYHPVIKPADFSADVTNPWLPLLPGSTSVYRGVKDGKPSRDVFVVAATVRVIDGVPCRVVDDRLYLEGALEERTTDYYTQDSKGNVWYFGEDTAELDAAGKVTSTEGSWHAGVDGAEPGIFMPAQPAVGAGARQEYYAGHAEDQFAVVSLASPATVPYGSYKDALLTKEWTRLEPAVLDHKYYVKGIGEVAELSVHGPVERARLVSFRPGSSH